MNAPTLSEIPAWQEGGSMIHDSLSEQLFHHASHDQHSKAKEVARLISVNIGLLELTHAFQSKVPMPPSVSQAAQNIGISRVSLRSRLKHLALATSNAQTMGIVGLWKSTKHYPLFEKHLKGR